MSDRSREAGGRSSEALDELRRLSEAATSGQWYFDGSNRIWAEGMARIGKLRVPGVSLPNGNMDDSEAVANSALIAAAVNYVRARLASPPALPAREEAVGRSREAREGESAAMTDAELDDLRQKVKAERETRRIWGSGPQYEAFTVWLPRLLAEVRRVRKALDEEEAESYRMMTERDALYDQYVRSPGSPPALPAEPGLREEHAGRSAEAADELRREGKAVLVPTDKLDALKADRDALLAVARAARDCYDEPGAPCNVAGCSVCELHRGLAHPRVAALLASPPPSSAGGTA